MADLYDLLNKRPQFIDGDIHRGDTVIDIQNPKYQLKVIRDPWQMPGANHPHPEDKRDTEYRVTVTWPPTGWNTILRISRLRKVRPI